MAEPGDGPPYMTVTAYCAPGLKHYAARLLETRGERYGQIQEHPYLAGQTSIVLTTNPHWPGETADQTP